MSPPRNYDELRRTHEQIEAEKSLPTRPTQPTDQAPAPEPKLNPELSKVSIEVRGTDDQERAEYIQNLRDMNRRTPQDIDHTERKMENLALVDHEEKRQAAEIAEKRAKEQPSEDYLPQRDKRERAFPALRIGEMTYSHEQRAQQLSGSRSEDSAENEKDERIARLLEDHHDKRKRDEALTSMSGDRNDRLERSSRDDVGMTEAQRERMDRMRDTGASERENSQDMEDGVPDLSRDTPGGGRTL